MQANNVPLPDEYDQIYNDLEHYWGVDPTYLRQIAFEFEGHRDSYTIGKLLPDDVVSLLNYSMEDEHLREVMGWGVRPQMDAIAEVSQHIPPFRGVVSPSDGPSLLTDWEWRTAAVEAARQGTRASLEFTELSYWRQK